MEKVGIIDPRFTWNSHSYFQEREGAVKKKEKKEKERKERKKHIYCYSPFLVS